MDGGSRNTECRAQRGPPHFWWRAGNLENPLRKRDSLLVSLESGLGLGLEPSVVFFGGDHFHAAHHVAVAVTTELAADHVSFERLDRCEPHRDLTTGNRVLLDAHR